MSEKNYRVIAVDDEPVLLRVLTRALSQRGFEVVTYEDPEQALEALRADVRSFDVGLFDVDMPVLDGITLLSQTRDIDRELPILMLTGNCEAKTATRALKAGAVDYLTKPLQDHDAVARTLMAAAENGALRRKVRELEERLQSTEQFAEIVGASSAMRKVFAVTDRLASLDVGVLLTGESGTGKELVARALHNRSARKANTMVALNCGAIPENLVDSELFGHTKGAFTGATDARAGAFERANGGTLFLDEIGDMPLPVQTRLLRVLQEEEITRLGGGTPIAVDVRVVAATHVDLEASIEAGNFREDLYYRLNIVRLEIPPLRQRADDIPLLALHFLKKHSKRLELKAPQLTPDCLAALIRYPWPGNVRELENAMQGALALNTSGKITADALPQRIQNTRVAETESSDPEWAWTEGLTLSQSRKIVQERFEHAYALRALRAAGGNISEAAKLAGMDRSNMRRLINRCEIKPADYQS